MKKSIYLLGMAVAALSSCSQSDVVEMPDSRAIGFNTFVNNNTRAVNEVKAGALSGTFYVFGNYGESDFANKAFDNEPSTALHYWEASMNYRFGAYQNGTEKITSAKFTAAASNSKLEFPAYTPDDKNDLIAAFGEATTGQDLTGVDKPAKVNLTFSHLLSQVKFTFTTDATAAYNLTISDVKITNAINKSTCTYTAGTPNTIVWANTGEGVDKNGYAYEDFKEGKAISIENSASQSKLVIPQSGTNLIKVTFKAKVDGAGITTEVKDFEGFLVYEAGSNTWNPGFRYNYSVKINVKDIVENPDDLVKIEFTPTVDSDWTDVNAGEVADAVVQP